MPKWPNPALFSWLGRGENPYANLNYVDFRITLKCNYKCEYCVAGCGRQENSEYAHADAKTIHNFQKLLVKIPRDCRVKLVGGEPTVHPQFFEVVKTILENEHTLDLITNFSLPNQYFRQIIDLVKNKPIKLRASLHLSQVKSVDLFIQKILDLKSYGKSKIMLAAAGVLTEDNYKLLRAVQEELAQNNIHFVFQHQMDYSKKEYICYADPALNRIENKLYGKNYYGIPCHAGHRYIRIYENGRLARCSGYNKNKKFLGNINGRVQLLKGPRPCQISCCDCMQHIAPNFSK